MASGSGGSDENSQQEEEERVGDGEAKPLQDPVQTVKDDDDDDELRDADNADVAPQRHRSTPVPSAAVASAATAIDVVHSFLQHWEPCPYSSGPPCYRYVAAYYCSYCTYTVCTACFKAIPPALLDALQQQQPPAPPRVALSSLTVAPMFAEKTGSRSAAENPSHVAYHDTKESIRKNGHSDDRNGARASRSDLLKTVVTSSSSVVQQMASVLSLSSSFSATDETNGLSPLAQQAAPDTATNAAPVMLSPSHTAALSSSSSMRSCAVRCHLCRRGKLVREEALLHEWVCEGPVPEVRVRRRASIVYDTDILPRYLHMKEQREKRVACTQKLSAHFYGSTPCPAFQGAVNHRSPRTSTRTGESGTTLVTSPNHTHKRRRDRAAGDATQKKAEAVVDPMNGPAAAAVGADAPRRPPCCEEGGSFDFAVHNPRTAVTCVWCAVNEQPRNTHPAFRGDATLTPVLTWVCPPSLPGLPPRRYRVAVPYGVYGLHNVHALALFLRQDMYRKASTQLTTAVASAREGGVTSASGVPSSVGGNGGGTLAAVKIAPSALVEPLLMVQVLHHVASSPRPLPRLLLPPPRPPLYASAVPPFVAVADGEERKPTLGGRDPTPAHLMEGEDEAEASTHSTDAPDGANTTNYGEHQSSGAVPPPPPAGMREEGGGEEEWEWPDGLASPELSLCVDHLLHGRSVAVYGVGSKYFFLHHVAHSAELASYGLYTIDGSAGAGGNASSTAITQLRELHRYLRITVEKEKEELHASASVPSSSFDGVSREWRERSAAIPRDVTNAVLAASATQTTARLMTTASTVDGTAPLSPSSHRQPHQRTGEKETANSCRDEDAQQRFQGPSTSVVDVVDVDDEEEEEEAEASRRGTATAVKASPQCPSLGSRHDRNPWRELGNGVGGEDADNLHEPTGDVVLSWVDGLPSAPVTPSRTRRSRSYRTPVTLRQQSTEEAITARTVLHGVQTDLPNDATASLRVLPEKPSTVLATSHPSSQPQQQQEGEDPTSLPEGTELERVQRSIDATPLSPPAPAAAYRRVGSRSLPAPSTTASLRAITASGDVVEGSETRDVQAHSDRVNEGLRRGGTQRVAADQTSRGSTESRVGVHGNEGGPVRGRTAYGNGGVSREAGARLRRTAATALSFVVPYIPSSSSVGEMSQHSQRFFNTGGKRPRDEGKENEGCSGAPLHAKGDLYKVWAPRVICASDDVRRDLYRRTRRLHTHCVRWLSMPSTVAHALQQSDDVTYANPYASHHTRIDAARGFLPLRFTRRGHSAPLLLVVHTVDGLDGEAVALLAHLQREYGSTRPRLQLLVSFEGPQWPLTASASALSGAQFAMVALRSLLLPRIHELRHTHTLNLLTSFEAAGSGGGGLGGGGGGGAGTSLPLLDTMRRILDSLPDAFANLLEKMIAIQQEAGASTYVSVFTIANEFSKQGEFVSQGRLKALLGELTSNRLAVYDGRCHALMIPQHLKLQAVLKEVLAKRRGEAGTRRGGAQSAKPTV